MTARELERCRRQFEQHYKAKLPFPDQVSERRSPTYDYNCHGLTFLSRRAWFDEDVEGDPIGMVLADDGYQEIARLEDVRPGDIVVYRTPAGWVEHTGVVLWIDEKNRPPIPWILSKWANLGEYIHAFSNSPYRGRACFMREGSDASPGTDE